VGGRRSFRNVEDLDEEVRDGTARQLETESLVTGVLYVSLEVAQRSAAAGLPPVGAHLSGDPHASDRISSS
jgi:hypothetical protein